MEEFLTQNKSITSYYQNVQNNYYNNARITERNNILNKMQRQYENYTFNTEQNNSYNTTENTIDNNSFISQNNADNIINKNNNIQENYNSTIPKNNNNNPLNNLDLSNISNLFNGGNIQNVLLNLLSKENNQIGSILKLMQNPMIKNTFSKKRNNLKKISDTDIIENKNEIDKFEKIEN